MTVPQLTPLLLLLLLTLPRWTFAQEPQSQLTDISLEDLMNVEVTSVSKKGQKLSKAGAAIYVITQEDIRRSGMTNIPDILRLAPGVNVARLASNVWAISIRGFNDRFSSKVLVLIDGRSVYTQEYSGVQWDQQAVPIEDIDRIEVIRGPGGTVWGANAVNGVINILTKHSKNTEGTLLSASGGSHDTAQGMLRYGGKAGKLGSYRVYARRFQVTNSFFENRRAAPDSWHGTQLGFRTDLELSRRDSLTLEGDLFKEQGSQSITVVQPKNLYRTETIEDPMTANNKNLLGRWQHAFSNGSESTLQMYRSDVRRREQGFEHQKTVDLEFQYHFHLGQQHDFVSTTGYRRATLAFNGEYGFNFRSPLPASQLFHSSLQDAIKLPQNLVLTVGSKFEHNTFTGFEIEPSAQLMWSPDDRKSLWISAARAIRQPSWVDTYSVLDLATFPIDGGGFGVSQVQGNPNVQAEQVFDLEVGYRMQIGKKITLDAAAFRSHYTRLSTIETGSPIFVTTPVPAHIVVPSWFENQAQAVNFGGEIFANWRVSSRWRLTPGYSFLNTNVARNPGSTDMFIEAAQGKDPKHQVQLRSALNLSTNLEWDTSAFYVSQIHSRYGGILNTSPSYTRLDSRIGWRLGESSEISITGQNLLSPRHSEFLNSHLSNVTQVSRAFVARIRWTF